MMPYRIVIDGVDGAVARAVRFAVGDKVADAAVVELRDVVARAVRFAVDDAVDDVVGDVVEDAVDAVVEIAVGDAIRSSDEKA